MGCQMSLDIKRVGIIGYGMMGKHWAPIVAAHPCTDLVAVADVRAEAREEAERTHGCEVFSSA